MTRGGVQATSPLSHARAPPKDDKSPISLTILCHHTLHKVRRRYHVHDLYSVWYVFIQI